MSDDKWGLEGRLFLSHPHINDIFFLLMTTVVTTKSCSDVKNYFVYNC